jgi:hypothetical protein
MKIIFVIILSLVGLIIFLITAIRVMVKYTDYASFKVAKKYCYENDLEFKEAKAFPNHYGLYFKKKGKSYYANYDFELKRGILWKKGSPLDKINTK